jgi:hypothetical protein
MNIYEGNNVQKNIMANQYKPTNTVQKNTTVNQPKTGIFNNPSSQPTAGINKVNNNIHAALGGTMDNKKVGTNGARQTVQNWLNRGNPQNNVMQPRVQRNNAITPQRPVVQQPSQPARKLTADELEERELLKRYSPETIATAKMLKEYATRVQRRQQLERHWSEQLGMDIYEYATKYWNAHPEAKAKAYATMGIPLPEEQPATRGDGDGTFFGDYTARSQKPVVKGLPAPPTYTQQSKPQGLPVPPTEQTQKPQMNTGLVDADIDYSVRGYNYMAAHPNPTASEIEYFKTHILNPRITKIESDPSMNQYALDDFQRAAEQYITPSNAEMYGDKQRAAYDEMFGYADKAREAAGEIAANERDYQTRQAQAAAAQERRNILAMSPMADAQTQERLASMGLTGEGMSGYAESAKLQNLLDRNNQITDIYGQERQSIDSYNKAYTDAILAAEAEKQQQYSKIQGDYIGASYGEERDARETETENANEHDIGLKNVANAAEQNAITRYGIDKDYDANIYKTDAATAAAKEDRDYNKWAKQGDWAHDEKMYDKEEGYDKWKTEGGWAHDEKMYDKEEGYNKWAKQGDWAHDEKITGMNNATDRAVAGMRSGGRSSGSGSSGNGGTVYRLIDSDDGGGAFGSNGNGIVNVFEQVGKKIGEGVGKFFK